MQCSAIQCSATQFTVVHCSSVQCSAIQYHSAVHSTSDIPQLPVPPNPSQPLCERLYPWTPVKSPYNPRSPDARLNSRNSKRGHKRLQNLLATVGSVQCVTGSTLVLYCTALHCPVLHSTLLYCTTLHCTVLNYTVLCCTVLHCPVCH